MRYLFAEYKQRMSLEESGTATHYEYPVSSYLPCWFCVCVCRVLWGYLKFFFWRVILLKAAFTFTFDEGVKNEKPSFWSRSFVSLLV